MSALNTRERRVIDLSSLCVLNFSSAQVSFTLYMHTSVSAFHLCWDEKRCNLDISNIFCQQQTKNALYVAEKIWVKKIGKTENSQ